MSEVNREPEAEPRHTFGGRSFDRHVFEFEVGDPSGLGDPGVGDPAGGDPAPGEWTGIQQDQWEQFTQQQAELASTVQALAQLEQQRAQVYSPPQQQQGIDPDRFWDDPIGTLREIVRNETAPLAQHHQQTQTQENEERIADMLADEAAKGGDFDTKIARMRVEGLAFELAPRYGGDLWKATQEATRIAAEEQRAYEAKQYEAAVARYTNQLSTLSGVPGEPGSTYTQGVQQHTMPDYSKGGSVTQKFFGGGQ